VASFPAVSLWSGNYNFGADPELPRLARLAQRYADQTIDRRPSADSFRAELEQVRASMSPEAHGLV
jgi:hypothetical protein